MTGDYLQSIVDRKREEIASLAPRVSDLRAASAAAAPPRPWSESLRQPGKVGLIAELKRRAPSAGDLRPGMDPAALARSYQSAGAAALSVLTDADFDGDLDDLVRARGEVAIPTLRKDFILDRVQVWESRAAGADAVLLIVRALSDGQLEELLDAAGESGLGTLVEVHDLAELERALATDAQVIGINNRDLRTLATNLDVTRQLAPAVPADRILVAESGIESPEHVEQMGDLGVDAVLVGRALMSSADPQELAARMAGKRRCERS